FQSNLRPVDTHSGSNSNEIVVNLELILCKVEIPAKRATRIIFPMFVLRKIWLHRTVQQNSWSKFNSCPMCLYSSEQIAVRIFRCIFRPIDKQKLFISETNTGCIKIVIILSCSNK